jgi:polyisoprenoid-binding protein YceI
MNERPAIDLHIHGKGLMLSGTFAGWQSRLILGPDLDDVGVSLFVDSTSVGVKPKDVDTSEKLFSFRSKSVESLGRGRYRVIGDFTGAEPTRELALDVETPLGHTPLIAVSFAAEKKDFGEGYQALVESATLFDAEKEGEGPRPEAAGWLVVPEVGSA